MKILAMKWIQTWIDLMRLVRTCDSSYRPLCPSSLGVGLSASEMVSRWSSLESDLWSSTLMTYPYQEGQWQVGLYLRLAIWSNLNEAHFPIGSWEEVSCMLGSLISEPSAKPGGKARESKPSSVGTVVTGCSYKHLHKTHLSKPCPNLSHPSHRLLLKQIIHA